MQIKYNSEKANNAEYNIT